MSLILALALSVTFEPETRVQLMLEATHELSLSPATARGTQVDGIFGPLLSVSIPVRGAHWLSFALGGRAGTLGGRATGSTQTVSASSRDGVIDLRFMTHLPLRVKEHLELRIGPLTGVALQIVKADVLVASRSQAVSASLAVEAGARLALLWHRAVFSFDVYAFLTPAGQPPRFVASASVGVVLVR